MSTLQPPGPHDAALLLPWYINGTLAENEHRAVAAHLHECSTCRRELESIHEVRQQAHAVFAGSPVPARLHAEVMCRVKAQAPRRLQPGFTPSRSAAAPSSRRPPRPASSRTLLQSLVDALQSVRQPRWAAALAVLVIVVQAGALGWFALNARPEPQVRSRSVESSPTRISIVFNPQATEAEIRAAMTALGGRIVDGPSEEGAYLVELPSLAPTVLSQRLREMRARPGLVERIENAAP
jgi:anti-sigma factor RsiW